MDDLKQRAIELRRKGLTYQEISSALDGALSVDQCKRLLKGVKKEKTNDPALEEIITLAVRPEGCTNYELTGVLYKYQVELKGDYMTSYKRKAKTRNKECLFRPGWMPATQPKLSVQRMNMMASDLFERIQENVNEFLFEFPEADRKSVVNELVKISNGWLLPESLEARLERNATIAQELEERNCTS